MIYIDFSLTDTTFFNAQRDWRAAGKTEAEVSALTGELIKKKSDEFMAGNAPSVLDLFPAWLTAFLRKEVSDAGGGKLTFDAANASFKAALPFDDIMEAKEWYASFAERHSALVQADPERAKFHDRMQLHAALTLECENEAMADLENHARGAAKQAWEKLKKKQEEEVESLSGAEDDIEADGEEEAVPA